VSTPPRAQGVLDAIPGKYLATRILALIQTFV
jgi:hypothetical protein